MTTKFTVQIKYPEVGWKSWDGNKLSREEAETLMNNLKNTVSWGDKPMRIFEVTS